MEYPCIPYVPSAEEIATSAVQTVCLIIGCGLLTTAFVGGFLYIVASVANIKKTLAKFEEKKED